LTTVTLVSTN